VPQSKPEPRPFWSDARQGAGTRNRVHLLQVTSLHFERTHSCRRNSNPDNLDRPIARHHLALCCYKPGSDEPGQQRWRLKT
jgi:hypothetical protein